METENKGRKERMLQKIKKAQEASEELHKNWNEEISEEDKRWNRMIADISLCLSDAMQKKGVTQRALAEKMGVKESSISRLLGSDHNPTLRTLAKLEAAIGETLVITPRAALRFMATGSVDIPIVDEHRIFGVYSIESHNSNDNTYSKVIDSKSKGAVIDSFIDQREIYLNQNIDIQNEMFSGSICIS